MKRLSLVNSLIERHIAKPLAGTGDPDAAGAERCRCSVCWGRMDPERRQRTDVCRTCERSEGKEVPKMEPGDLFTCEALHCRLSAGACIQRQAARKQNPVRPAFPDCGKGNCPQGRLVRLALPRDYMPPPYEEDRSPQDRARQRSVERRNRGKVAPPTAAPPPTPIPEAVALPVLQPEQLDLQPPPQKEAPPMSDESPGTCSSCKKPLRANQKGRKCYYCRRRDGEVKRWAPKATDEAAPPAPARATSAPPPGPPAARRSRLPHPSTLTTEEILDYMELLGQRLREIQDRMRRVLPPEQEAA